MTGTDITDWAPLDGANCAEHGIEAAGLSCR